MSANVLKVNDVTMQFGGVVAVNNLSMEANEGEIVALIGPNGAGKTTIFNCITGVYEPTNGEVVFCGETIAANHPQGKMRKLYAGENNGKYTRVVRLTPDKITKRGIARTFQNIRLFKTQTVFDNVLIAMHLRRTSNVFTATFRLNWKEERAMREETLRLLEIVGLAQEKDELATSLPYGKQRRLEIARALATKPKLLHARRTRRRHEPAGDGGACAVYCGYQESVRADRFPDRASHGSGDGHFRSHLRDRLWQKNRRGHAGRNSG